jgi:hypothetical protein
VVQRKKWETEWMKDEDLKNKEMGSSKSLRVFKVLETTLELYVKDRQKNSGVAVKPNLSRKKILPCEAKRRLVSRLTTCCKKRN